MFGEVPIPDVSGEDKIALIRLAVCLEHNMGLKFGKYPSWLSSPELIAVPPYLGCGYDETWLFEAAQANYNHDFFIDRGAMEII
jgi:hypothetical protein